MDAYLVKAQDRCESPASDAQVIPLVDIHPQMAELWARAKKYTRDEFAQDIYRMQSCGLDAAPSGAQFQLPISRGVPRKTLTATNNDGRDVPYYGIRFMQTERIPTEVSDPSGFDPLDGPLYDLAIRDLLSSQLDWPSPEFVGFLPAQFQLEALTAVELRQFAQITRDSLQGFVYDRTDGGKGSNAPVNIGPDLASAVGLPPSRGPRPEII